MVMRAPRARETILYGGMAAAILDILDALVVFGARGVSPARVLQAIASGAFGARAFQGGPAMAAAGLAFHFLIALTVAGVYYALARRVRLLVERPILSGLAFGVAVYVVMQYVVLPLSSVRVRPQPWSLILNGVLIHAFGVGLPIALAAAWSAQPPAVRPAKA